MNNYANNSEMTNNYFDSKAPTNAQLILAAQGGTTNKQQTLKKKHFAFQTSQFENFLNQTQQIGGENGQFTLPLTSYDLTQINLNGGQNNSASQNRAIPSTNTAGNAPTSTTN